MNAFEFCSVRPDQKPLILSWLARPHIAEWLHGDGYGYTLESLDLLLSGGAVETSHTIAYRNGCAFAYVLSSRVEVTETRYAAVPFRGSTAFSIDVFVGDPADTGHGYGTEMLRAFLTNCLSDASDAVIDPEVSNERAVHVYSKLGFRIVETFIAPWHPVPHFLMHMALPAVIGRTPE